MSLRRNTAANYLGQGYSILVEIVVTPLYLQFLGAEAFGLVGFLALLHAWLRLLDVGLSPTLARQAAFAVGESRGVAGLGSLLRSFEIIVIGMAVVIVAGIGLGSGVLAEHWLRSEAIDQATVAQCIALMGAVVGIRFVGSLYASGVRGLEDQVWLNAASSVLATLRVLGALFLLVFVSNDIRLFFEYQVLVALLEVIVLARRLYRRLGLAPAGLPLRIDAVALREVAPFAASVAYTTGLWVLVSQTDKLVLSTLLPLQQFGYFTLVSLMAGGIVLVSDPIARAILPRMTGLFAAGRHGEMLRIYHHASQLVAVFSVSAALFLACLAEAIVFAWTGDRTAAAWCGNVLPWFALGNGILSLAALQYYLQYAMGTLRLHVIGSTLSATIQVPAIVFAALEYGATGAGIAWLGVRAVWFLVWTAVVHRSLVPGLHRDWLLRDLLPTFLTGAAAVFVVARIAVPVPGASRGAAGVTVVAAGLVFVAVVALSSDYVRSLLRSGIRGARHGAV